jgi:hypothetical protein
VTHQVGACDEERVLMIAEAVDPPPTRFTAVAKEAWASVPEAVRADVLRMERELTAGLRQHQAAAARDAELADFHDRAAKGSTTLKEVLSRYVDMEDMLRTDPDKGLGAVFQNIGISPWQWARNLLGMAEEVAVNEEVAKFAAAHPRFEELSEDIVFFIDTGRANGLADAYSLAERFSENPAPEGHLP